MPRAVSASAGHQKDETTANVDSLVPPSSISRFLSTPHPLSARPSLLRPAEQRAKWEPFEKFQDFYVKAKALDCLISAIFARQVLFDAVLIHLLY